MKRNKNISTEKIVLPQKGIAFNAFGAEHIEQAALNQMHIACKLPVSIAGALMPDAHAGYGLPIGGVLATRNAIIPFAVGVDIGCRMCLSVFDIPAKDIERKEKYFVRTLQESTLFGSGKQFDEAHDHPVMDSEAFKRTPLLRNLQHKAWKQLGSSGSGNHFVEFGVVDILEKDDLIGIEAGSYISLLSHSGSRALGANIANFYTQVARQKRPLNGESSNLAWLHMNEAEGAEYWMAMNLAGDYAVACHQVIHAKIASQLGRQPIAVIDNHHNFAWKEVYEGEELIVHRKGATPAGKNVLGIIPGSMTAPGFIVKGRGESASVFSASHGAGRKISRSKANASITRKAVKEILKRHRVTLLGGGLDEAPQAYKNIEVVMKSQRALVDVVGQFTPRIVRMDG